MEMIETLPQLGHVGYIVNDVNSSSKWYGKLINADFYIYEFIPLRAWVGEEEIFDCHFKIGMGTLKNGSKIELIQPISGATTPHMQFLKQKGENIHHTAFIVKNYDQWKKYFISDLEANIIFEAETEDDVIGFRRCFYAQPKHSVGIVEIAEIPWKRK